MSSITAAHHTPTPAEALRVIVGWLKRHPKIRYTLFFLAVCTICYFINISTAFATDTETESRAFDLPLVGVTDTHGVPIWRYEQLPLDPGNNAFSLDEGLVRSVRYIIASIFWAFYAVPILLLLALVDWVVSFEWLSWIASPFETIAEGVSGVMEAWMIIPLGVAISALWIGFGYLRGRTGAATVEFAMVILVFGVIASPVADPFSWMTGESSETSGESGLIRQAADAGAEAGGMTINEDADPEDVTLTGSIIDITLRQTMLNMAFGSSLDGDCEEAWNEEATAGIGEEGDIQSVEEVREAVIECDEAVADANQTSSFTWLFDYILAWPASLGILFLLGVFLFFLIWQVFQAFISAVVAVVRAFWALFPGNSRTAWMNSLFQVLVSAVLIGAYIFGLTVYMWAMGEIVDILPAPLIRVASTLLGILILIAAFTFWRMKKAGQSLADRLSKAFGKTGLSKEGPEKQPSKFGTTAKSLTGGAARKGFDMWRDARNARRMVNGLSMAAGAGTGGVGGLAVKAASTAAAGRLAARAAQNSPTSGAKLPGVKGALPTGAITPKPSPTGGAALSTPLPARGDAPLPAPTPSGTPGPDPKPHVSTRAGADGEPYRPLRPNDAPREGVPPATVSGAERASHQDQGDSSQQPAPPEVRPSTRGVPVEQQQDAPHRLRNIPAGKYGGTYVHKNGQMHQPATTTPEGAPAQNIPREEKVSRTFQSDDRWLTGESRHRESRSRPHPRNQEPQPASPAQSPQPAPSQPRPTPRPMQRRSGGEFHRGGGNQ